jgi:hypothetical protein
VIPAGIALVLLSGAVLSAPLPPGRPGVAAQTIPSANIVPAAGEAAHSATATPSITAGQMVCRDPRLMGDPRPYIIDIGDLACGIDDPVRVTSISGIHLSQPALLGCPTARRLADWLTGIAQPEARAKLGAGIAQVTVMGSYACRTRNNAGGQRSKHARGRAIDIGGFTLTNDARVTVAADWGETPAGAFLREIWRKGCGPFATMLGPEANRQHKDHLHLDTSPGGGEPYCQ